MNFVCRVFEQGDEMLTLLSMEKTIVECNLKATPTLKSSTGDQRNTRKRIYQGCSVWIEKYIPPDHCLALQGFAE